MSWTDSLSFEVVKLWMRNQKETNAKTFVFCFYIYVTDIMYENNLPQREL